MADPLTQAAESLAPAPAGPTNYFDPEPGRNVISRYGNAAALGRDIGNALRLDAMARQSRLGAMREQEFMDAAPLRAREREVGLAALDEEELALRDKQAARDARVGLIEGLSQIDPEAPDYLEARTALMQGLPQGVLQDDVVSDILKSKDSRYEATQRLRDDLEKKKAQQEKEMAVLNTRMQQKYGFEGVSPEMRQQFLLPDGSYDMVGLAYAAGEAASGRRIKETQAKTDIRQEAAKERMQMYLDRKEMESSKRDAYDRAMNHLVDKTAFPSEVDRLRKQYLADNPGTKESQVDTLLESKMPTELARAQERDKNREGLFTEQARDMDMESFVNAAGDIPEANKAKRRAFWQVANDQEIAAPSAADQAVDAPRVDMPGFEADERPPAVPTAESYINETLKKLKVQ